MKRIRFLPLLILASLLIALVAQPALADTPATTQGIVLSTSYTSVITEAGNSVTFSLEVSNNSADYQEVALKAEGPADWNPSFRQGGYSIRSIMVGPGKSQSVDFQVRPPEGAKPQDYAFQIKALGSDGNVLSQLRVTVTLTERPAVAGLKLTTQYPESQGQAGNTITFRVTVSNDASEDRSINLAATAPSDWQVTFKPAYETRQVNVISMKAGATQDLDVDVAVPRLTEAGEYPVTVRATADRDHAEVNLKVTVTGNMSMSLSTSSGQLSTTASIDSPTKMTLLVRNTGTAPLKNISLSASSPDGWEVTFDPKQINELPVDQVAQVNASIKPSSKALTGDYMVTITASAGSASDSKDIRVTVETPTTWGWVAVAAIALVIGGLAYTFARFSRR
jgi:uncharacterized membrane protein